MLYLILAILSSAMIAVIMRVSQRFTRNGMAVLAANYAACLAAALLLTGGITPAGEGLGLTVLLGGLQGVMYLLGFVLLQWNIRRSGVVLPATFQRLGVLVPTIAAITVFGEALRWSQLLGVALAVFAILFMQEKGDKTNARGLLGLMALLLCGGFGDVMAKAFQTWGSPAQADLFLVFTFVTALALAAGLCAAKKQPVAWQDLLCGVCLGIPNYMSARFLLWSLNELPAVVVYPTFSVAAIIAVTLVGVLAFREKLEKRKVIALGMIMGALVLLNV